MCGEFKKPSEPSAREGLHAQMIKNILESLPEALEELINSAAKTIQQDRELLGKVNIYVTGGNPKRALKKEYEEFLKKNILETMRLTVGRRKLTNKVRQELISLAKKILAAIEARDKKSGGERKELDLKDPEQLIKFLLGPREGQDKGRRLIGRRYFLYNFPDIFEDEQGIIGRKEADTIKAAKPELYQSILQLWQDREKFKDQEEWELPERLLKCQVGEQEKVIEEYFKEKGYKNAEHFYDLLACRYDAKIVLLSVAAVDCLVDQGEDVNRLDILPEIKDKKEGGKVTAEDWQRAKEPLEKYSREELIKILDGEAERLEKLKN